LLKPQEAANCIARKAESVSYEKNYFSPFAKNALDQTGRMYPGGKPDDITVVIG